MEGEATGPVGILPAMDQGSLGSVLLQCPLKQDPETGQLCEILCEVWFNKWDIPRQTVLHSARFLLHQKTENP
jgi:hypothetical protein